MSLAEQWRFYLDDVIPKGAGQTQVQETRRAFYAGAVACFAVLNSFLDGGTEPTDAEIQRVEGMVQELEDFSKSIGTPFEQADTRDN